jgi:imidazolonepropionase-like amidohydrolase
VKPLTKSPASLSLSKGCTSGLLGGLRKDGPLRLPCRRSGHASTGSGKRHWAQTIALATLLFTTPALAQTIAITGGKVAIGDGSAVIENGTVIITGGRITASGAGVAIPAGARRIDARGKWVTPGIVAGFSRIGMSEVEGVEPTNDTVAQRSPFSAVIDAADAVNPRAVAIPVSRSGGVTRAIIAPSTAQSIFAGQGAVIDTGADMDAITKPRAFQYMEFGEGAAAEAGGSRSAAWAYFRNAVQEARDFRLGRSGDDRFLKRPDAAALLPVIDGLMPLMVHVESATDILKVLKLKQDIPAIRLILAGVGEGWEVADRIAAAKVPVVVDALSDLPDSFEVLSATQSNAGRLRKAGVMVSLGSLNRFESLQARTLTQDAGNMVALTRVPGATGLSWGEALASITSRPAEMIGMGTEIGSLKVGRRADVVIWDGDPLELSSAATQVFIDGVDQPLGNRQLRLRDRYRTAPEGDLPKAYDR